MEDDLQRALASPGFEELCDLVIRELRVASVGRVALYLASMLGRPVTADECNQGYQVMTARWARTVSEAGYVPVSTEVLVQDAAVAPAAVVHDWESLEGFLDSPEFRDLALVWRRWMHLMIRAWATDTMNTRFGRTPTPQEAEEFYLQATRIWWMTRMTSETMPGLSTPPRTPQETRDPQGE